MDIKEQNKAAANEIAERRYEDGLIRGAIIGTVTGVPALIHFGAPLLSAAIYATMQAAAILCIGRLVVRSSGRSAPPPPPPLQP